MDWKYILAYDGYTGYSRLLGHIWSRGKVSINCDSWILSINRRLESLRVSHLVMDNILLIVSLFLTLLFIAITTYWFFLRPSTRIGPVIYLVGPSGSGKTALWTYVLPSRSTNVLTNSSNTGQWFLHKRPWQSTLLQSKTVPSTDQ